MIKKRSSNIIKIAMLVIISIFIVSCNRKHCIGPIIDIGNSEVFSSDAPIHNQYSIQAEMREPLADAIKTWNEKVGRELFSDKIGKNTIYVMWVNELSYKFGNDETVYGLSYKYPDKCVIELLNKGTEFDKEIYLIAMHEIGHCLGFSHSPNKKSLMYQAMSKEVRFTKHMIDIVNATNVSVSRDRNEPR